ncbi:hypothetical protein FRC0431_02138 [Corynebacterium diphtheriae]|nr:hypothetical protein FRC0431_02138 [Corynebacterium diphtheriae]
MSILLIVAPLGGGGANKSLDRSIPIGIDLVDNLVYNRNMSRKGTSMATPLHIAAIGANAAGLYTADLLMRCHNNHRNIHVDIIDPAPAPIGISPYAQTTITHPLQSVTTSTTKVIGGVTVDADISATELSSRYAAVITPATTDLAIQAQAAAALTALPQPAVDLPGILRKRSIVHTEWRHSLHLPTGRSLADWQQALATAHGAPVCF